MIMAGAATMDTERLTVWIVEDNRLLRENLAELVNEQPDMECLLAVESCEEFLAALEEGAVPDVVLMDLGLPGSSGTEGLTRLHTVSPATRAIVLTIHEEDEKVFEAICAGASGYLLKPSPPKVIVDAIRQARLGAAPINGFIANKVLAMFPRLARPKPPEDEYGVTTRERQILQLLVDGLTMKQIAGRLNLSYHTVGNHLRNIYHKLHVRSRSGAVAKALREELV
jgi:DNA-binding NarL/FixJ family response regulator